MINYKKQNCINRIHNEHNQNVEDHEEITWVLS